MGRQRPTGMYRNVDFASEGIEYERAYRLETIGFFRDLKEKRGLYRRKTKWWMGYSKSLPGIYRTPYRRRNDYVKMRD